MTAEEIQAGLTVEPFDTDVSQAQDEWVVVWSYDGLEIGRATFKEVHEGVEWTRFNVVEEFRNRGLYTQALRWSGEIGRAYIAFGTAARDFYLSAGFKKQEGLLVQDKRKSASFLKGR